MEEDIKFNINFKVVLLIFSVLGLFILGLNSYAIVPAGHQGIVFSKASGVKDISLEEGFHFKKPFIESVIGLNVREQKIQGSLASVSKDQQQIKTDVAVNFKVSNAGAAKLYKEIGLDYESKIIRPAIEQSIKSSMAKYKADELINFRDEVALNSFESLKTKLNDKNIIILGVNIINIEYSSAYVAAIEAKVIAEQQEQKASNDLKRIQIEANQTVVKAKAAADAKLLEAAADAKSIQLRQEALEESEEVLRLEYINKWDGKLPKIVSNDNSNMLLDINSMVEE